MHFTGSTNVSRRGNLKEIKAASKSIVFSDESGWLKRSYMGFTMRPSMWWCVKQRQLRDLHLHSTPCPLQEATVFWLAMELEDASACMSQPARHRFGIRKGYARHLHHGSPISTQILSWTSQVKEPRTEVEKCYDGHAAMKLTFTKVNLFHEPKEIQNHMWVCSLFFFFELEFALLAGAEVGSYAFLCLNAIPILHSGNHIKVCSSESPTVVYSGNLSNWQFSVFKKA